MLSALQHPLSVSLLFQITWFMTISQASQGARWYAASACWLMILITLLLNKQKYKHLLKWGGLGLVLGLLCDGLSLGLGLYLPQSTPIIGPIPFWLLSLWSAFYVYLPIGLPRLLDYPLIASLLGGLTGPLSYFAGVKWGAMSLGMSPYLVYSMTAVSWALSMWVASFFYRSQSIQSSIAYD